VYFSLGIDMGKPSETETESERQEALFKHHLRNWQLVNNGILV
jgi:hypothetical protein